MKTCPVCGDTYSERIDFCFNDGAVLVLLPSALDAPLPRNMPAPEGGGPRSLMSRAPTVVYDEDEDDLPEVEITAADVPDARAVAKVDAPAVAEDAPPAPPVERPAPPVERPAPAPVERPAPAPAAEASSFAAVPRPAPEPPVDEVGPPPEDAEDEGPLGLVWVFVGLLLVGALGAGWWALNPPSAPTPVPSPTPTVETTTAPPAPAPQVAPPAPVPPPPPAPDEAPPEADDGPEDEVLPADDPASEDSPTADAVAPAPALTTEVRTPATPVAAPIEGVTASAPSEPAPAPAPTPQVRSTSPAPVTVPTPAPAAAATPPPSADATTPAPAAAAPLWDTPEVATQAKVTIQSTPSNASVQIDGSWKGETPLQVQLPFGAHELVLRHDGYAEKRQVLDVQSPSLQVPVSLDPVLLSGQFEIVFTGHTGEMLYIDGKQAGPLPHITTLQEGRHTFRIVGNEAAITRTRFLRPDPRGRLRIDLSRD